MLLVDNILDLSGRYGDDTVQELLDSFSCTKNPEIDGFVHDKALLFAKRGLAVTYLVYSEDGLLLGIFAIANKMLTVDTSNIGSTVIKKLKTFGKSDESSGRITVPGILIAQLGKNDENAGLIKGSELMHLAESKIAEVLYSLGGRVIYLECEHKQPLFDFYESCGYRNIGDRIQREHDSSDINYRVYLKFIDPVKFLR